MQSVAKCVQILEDQGLTRKSIAEQLGFEYESLRNLLRGKVKNPSWDVVTRLHRMAGVSLDSVLGIDNGLAGRLEQYKEDLQVTRKKLARAELERELFIDLIVSIKGQDAVQSIKQASEAEAATGDEDWMKVCMEDDVSELLSALNKDKERGQ